MEIDFEKLGGLVPAIIQDAVTKNVLMLGFMNQEAYDKTIATKKVTFWSRSRNCLCLINGQCVRLTKGDYDQKKVYNDNPADVAKQFEQMGFKRLHVVDLDGAKSKHIVNDAVLKAITTETSLVVDFGGGIKTEEDIEKAFAAGASMVTVGSIAVTNSELFLQWLEIGRASCRERV